MTKRQKRVKAKAYDSTTGKTIGDMANATKSKEVMKRDYGSQRTTMMGKGCNR